MLVLEVVRHERILLAENLPCAPPEYALGLGVPGHDAGFAVERDDGKWRCLQERREGELRIGHGVRGSGTGVHFGWISGAWDDLCEHQLVGPKHQVAGPK